MHILFLLVAACAFMATPASAVLRNPKTTGFGNQCCAMNRDTFQQGLLHSLPSFNIDTYMNWTSVGPSHLECQPYDVYYRQVYMRLYLHDRDNPSRNKEVDVVCQIPAKLPSTATTPASGMTYEQFVSDPRIMQIGATFSTLCRINTFTKLAYYNEQTSVSITQFQMMGSPTTCPASTYQRPLVTTTSAPVTTTTASPSADRCLTPAQSLVVCNGLGDAFLKFSVYGSETIDKKYLNGYLSTLDSASILVWKITLSDYSLALDMVGMLRFQDKTTMNTLLTNNTLYVPALGTTKSHCICNAFPKRDQSQFIDTEFLTMPYTQSVPVVVRLATSYPSASTANYGTCGWLPFTDANNPLSDPGHVCKTYAYSQQYISTAGVMTKLPTDPRMYVDTASTPVTQSATAPTTTPKYTFTKMCRTATYSNGRDSVYYPTPEYKDTDEFCYGPSTKTLLTSLSYLSAAVNPTNQIATTQLYPFDVTDAAISIAYVEWLKNNYKSGGMTTFYIAAGSFVGGLLTLLLLTLLYQYLATQANKRTLRNRDLEKKQAATNAILQQQGQ
jgi:hypothetical protein